ISYPPSLHDALPIYMRRRRLHLARIEKRPDALRPKAVVRAVPAVPAIKARVQHARRIAVEFGEAEAARPAILERAIRHMASCARSEEHTSNSSHDQT